MTKNETDRLRAVELKLERVDEKVVNIESRLNCIEKKLDAALENKVDMEDHKTLVSRLWGLATLVFSAFVGMIVLIIQGDR